MTEINIDSLYSEAEQYLDQNNINSALSTYNKLCKIDPDSAEPWFMLGVINDELGNTEQAINYFYKAIEIDPTHPDAHLNIAHHLSASGDNKGAIIHCELAIRHDSNYAEAWLFKSALLASNNQPSEAIAAISKALSIDSSLPQGWARLAQLEDNSGHYESAIQACKNAIAQNTHDIDSRKLLATLFLKMKKPTEAITSFDAVLNILPHDIEAVRGKGFAYLLDNDLTSAVKYFSLALDINPDCSASLLALARIHNIQANYDVSAGFCSRLIRLEPDNLDAQVQLANSLAGMGQHAKGLEYYNSVLGKNSAHKDALVGRANIFEKSGQYQNALIDLRPLLESSPTPESIFIFSRIAPHINQIPKAIELLESLLSSSENAQGQQAHYHLAQLYIQQNEHELAFINHARSNMLRNCEYIPEEIEQLVDWIIEEYTSSSLASAPVSNQDTSTPVFIVGMLRSGTTLVEQIIASHTEVCGAGELQEIPHIAQHLANNTRHKLLTPPSISSLTSTSLDKAAATYLERISQISNGARNVTDKMLYNAFHLGLIQLMFPNSRVIHCIRDPMDTCISNYFQNYSGYAGFATRLEYTGHFYRQFERIMEHWHDILKLPILKVSYENLVSDQNEVTRNILDFCGLSWDDACLKFYDNPRLANTASYNQVRQPMYDKAVTRWRHYQTHLSPLKLALGIDQ